MLVCWTSKRTAKRSRRHRFGSARPRLAKPRRPASASFSSASLVDSLVVFFPLSLAPSTTHTEIPNVRIGERGATLVTSPRVYGSYSHTRFSVTISLSIYLSLSNTVYTSTGIDDGDTKP